MIAFTVTVLLRTGIALPLFERNANLYDSAIVDEQVQKATVEGTYW
jgi:hypothetical protein